MCRSKNMLGKLLKRKDSRQTLDLHPTENKAQQDQKQNMLQYKYQRPDILGKVRSFTSRSFGIYRTAYSDNTTEMSCTKESCIYSCSQNH